MPTGQMPAATAAGQSVTITWPQSTFLGAPLGSYAGGGYTVKRHAEGGSIPLTPNAGCATTIGGAAATLQCVETGVPYGRWQYTITPSLSSSFTGDTSAQSATVGVATAAPGEAIGAIQLSWSAVAGATGYNVYRRTAGAFDFALPLNGSTPLGATAYSDPGAGLTGATTYRYVLRAVTATATIAAPEIGETVVFSAASPGSTPVAVTVAAGTS